MKYFKISFFNGYSNCGKESYFSFSSETEAEDYATENLPEYGAEYSHCGLPNDFTAKWEDDDIDAYYDNLTYSVEEITAEEYQTSIIQE